MAIVLIDLDDLKEMNKSSYSNGDSALRAVANEMSKTRGEGKVGRFGGDEFLLLLSELNDNKTGNLIIERIRGEIENCHEPPITVSCGLLYLDQNKYLEIVKLAQFYSVGIFDLIIKIIDNASKMAKEQGKNQAVDSSETKRVILKKSGSKYQKQLHEALVEYVKTRDE